MLFRQLDGLFDRAVNAIRLLVERNVRVVIGFTPTKLNWQHGPEVVALADRLGANAVNFSEYVPAGRGSTKLALEPDLLRRVLHDWICMREEHADRLQVIWHDCRVALLVPEHERRHYLGCGAGRLIARILPDGTVTPCVFLPTVIGSFRKIRFKYMWSPSAPMKQFRECIGHFSGNCGDCEYLTTCGGCRAVAFAYSGGDSLAGDPHCWINLESKSQMAGLVAGEGLPM